jgi:hypothetical protein
MLLGLIILDIADNNRPWYAPLHMRGLINFCHVSFSNCTNKSGTADMFWLKYSSVVIFYNPPFP